MDSCLLRRRVSAAILAGLTGCAALEPPDPAGGGDAVVHLLKDSLALTLDLVEQLGAIRTDREGNPAPARLQWRSGDKAVAVVDSTGAVTAVGLGRTWIEVSDTRRTDTAIVHTYIRFRTIHAGQDVTCGLAVGGQAACWGRNTYGALGDGRYLQRGEPALIEGPHRFTMLSVGAESACGLGVHLYCWGYNSYGQLGDGSTSPSSVPIDTP